MPSARCYEARRRPSWFAAVSLAIGMVVGTLLGVLTTYAPRYAAFVGQLYIGLIRGTPMVVQIMFIYFALPILLGVRFSALTAGTIALVVNSSAYLAEIVRSGLLAVPKGLRDSMSSAPSPSAAWSQHSATNTSSGSRTPRCSSSSGSAS
jgi:His/Glu/Gln/Arg/opine family amino acid ABC transporter permease subunit